MHYLFSLALRLEAPVRLVHLDVVSMVARPILIEPISHAILSMIAQPLHNDQVDDICQSLAGTADCTNQEFIERLAGLLVVEKKPTSFISLSDHNGGKKARPGTLRTLGMA